MGIDYFSFDKARPWGESATRRILRLARGLTALPHSETKIAGAAAASSARPLRRAASRKPGRVQLRFPESVTKCTAAANYRSAAFMPVHERANPSFCQIADPASMTPAPDGKGGENGRA